jgi:hypothetical protein
MAKMIARKRGAGPVEPQRKEHVLRKGPCGVLSEEDAVDDAHTVAEDAIKGYRLALFVGPNKLFGRICVSVFHAISTASLPTREGLLLSAYPDCVIPAHTQTRSLVTRHWNSSLQKIVGGQLINAVVWDLVQKCLRRYICGSEREYSVTVGNGEPH